MSTFNQAVSESRSHVAYLYNPANQSRKQLIEGFVIRTRQFQKIFKEISGTALDEPPQHFLIEGQRGSGKTSLMLRIRYELEDLAADYLLPLQLPEEQYGIISLCTLWEHVADELDEIEGFEGIIESFESHVNKNDYDIDCFEWLDRYLKNNNNRLVLFLDNFGDLLSKFSENEHQRLRDIFHTSKRIQIIAGSAQTLEQTYKYDQPFYEFFKIERLGSLSSPETISFMRSLARQHDAVQEINKIAMKEPERIESLRLLSGGVPRTIVLIFEILLDQNGEVFDDLETLLDRVTPLYKHRMEDLPRQQQAIVNAIALAWDGVSNKDIVATLKNKEFDGKKIAAQLRLLEQDNVVSSKMLDKKNKIYFIKERFFNIWYLMRLARKRDKVRVKWLVNFLQILYSPDQIEIRTRTHIKRIKEGALLPRGAKYWTLALAEIAPNLTLQDELIDEGRKYFQASGEDESELPESDSCRLDNSINAGSFHDFSKLLEKVSSTRILPEQVSNYYYGRYYSHNNEIGKAVKYYQLAIDKGHTGAMLNLGNLYSDKLKDYDKAIETYQMAVEKGDTGAMFNLGYLYKNELKDYDKAIETYQMAVEKGDTGAMNNLGILYADDLKDYDKAIETYQMAVEKGDTGAMFNLGNLYSDKLKDYDKAIETYQMAIDKGHTSAMFNLGYLYQNELKDYDKAIETYQMAVEKGDTGAMFNLGYLYQNELKDYDKAIETYQMAIDKGHTSAMFNLGYLYQNELKDYDKAIETYQMVIEKGDTGAMNSLAWLYFEQNNSKLKPEAAMLSDKLIEVSMDIQHLDTHASIMMWCNQFDKAYESARLMLSDAKYIDQISGVTDFFVFMMAKHQYHMAHKLFIEFPQLKEEIKPVYYALMKLLKDEYPKEHLKMGTELEEPVAKILENIESKRKKYSIT